MQSFVQVYFLLGVFYVTMWSCDLSSQFPSNNLIGEEPVLDGKFPSYMKFLCVNDFPEYKSLKRDLLSA